ncbi:Histidine kinase-, DNA gyrase B-, and HSP90-like ATPase [Desulfonatronum thiosulfatophilum]|uniref:histidine kinase n=1 Tax=Desulfonatronum thiosulfatophilum TaxID=617002 RepID=A0A1G6AKC4_9BACT|nr:ATP-binding protein [Desulfonatronum thiosulfatophilum]SDB08563.1 Histidine kinase-, DNA gyrase B-, and HSP90-like ATPase [Desulfonatronum thiosulfatophilum]
MNTRHGGFRHWLVVASSILAVSILHFGEIAGGLGLHAIHRELYFIPLLLAAFWFGLKRGLYVAMAVSTIYIAGLVFTGFHHQNPLTAGVQVAIFLIVTALLGRLSDNQRRKQAALIEAGKLETLGQAAGTLSQELKWLMDSIQDIHDKAGGFKDPELERRFNSEMKHAETLSTVLSDFIPERHAVTHAGDLNAVVKTALNNLSQDAAVRGIRFRLNVDVSGCPATTDRESVAWALNKILKNALEATPADKEITVTTKRGADDCRIEVSDQGPGIAEKHMEKIFTPFFTTKPGGQGLALASSRKSLRDLGGDILVSGGPGKGATFTIILPRELNRPSRV